MSENTGKSVALESHRLFRVRTVLMELDSNQEISYLNPVEVRGGDRRLGWASLSRDGNRIVADLVFAYACPERLSIETYSESLYARLEAVVTLDQHPFETVGLWSQDQGRASAIQVLGLEINRTPSYQGQPRLGEALL